jgi:hypothetical protein
MQEKPDRFKKALLLAEGDHKNLSGLQQTECKNEETFSGYA